MQEPVGIPSSVENAYQQYSEACSAIGEQPLRLVDLLGMVAMLASAEPLAQSVEEGCRSN